MQVLARHHRTIPPPRPAAAAPRPLPIHVTVLREVRGLVNNKSVGLGSAVKVGENFGIRINAIKDLANCLD